MSDAYRMLLLGEGNFSFTLALLKRLRTTSEKYTILSSSFDSRDQLVAKYPETVGYIADMLKDPNVAVLHDVDATNLRNNKEITGMFTDIIFNFPHMGKEDCNAHSSMLAHVMHSCIPMMDDSSTLSISLAEDQGHRWKIHEMASRNNLQPVSEIEFKANEWPGYVLMRHHVGRSFGGRVQRCLHYGFRLKTSSSDRKSVFQYLAERAISSDAPTAREAVAPSTSAKVGKVSDATPQGKVKKRKLDLAVEGHYHKVTLSDANPDSSVSATSSSSSSSSTSGSVNRFDAVSGEGWQCHFCNKILSTEQGIKTHVYCSHVNVDSLSGNSKTEASADVLQCPHCDKVAPNKDALDQHIGAKHGLNRDIKPAWALASKNATVEGTTGNASVPCDVCGMLFDSEESLRTHLDRGFIPLDLELSYNCSGCGKQFSDNRGKLQHENFCLLKSKG